MNSPAELRPGDVFAHRFEIESVLGAGAYGVVYRSVDRVTKADTALKILKPERLEAFTARWREASMLRRLDLPGVARLIAEGVEGGRPYLAMEHVSGRAFPRPSQPLPWEMIEGYVISLLRILALVHSAGLVHGDVKPGNVIIDDFGRVKLVDFGLSLSAVANDLEASRIHGTPLYMAPELFNGERFSPQSDLFAVGAMIFEAMAGRPFFETQKMVEWVRLLRTKGPPLLGDFVENPDPVARKLADMLLASNPARRPATAWDALKIVGGSHAETSAEWLGDSSPIDEALLRLEEESLRVGGVEGSGRSAFVNRIVQRLREDGRAVHVLRRAERPFESLLRAPQLNGSLPAVGTESELERAARKMVTDRIASGEVFAVANHSSPPDSWTSELLESLSTSSPRIVLAVDKPERANVEIERFGREELAQLFCGPELALHLPSRGADLLWSRTEGRRGLVFAETESWKRFHLAQEETDGQLKVSDRSLALLEQGLQTRAPVSANGCTELAYEAICWMSLLGGRSSIESLCLLMSQERRELELALAGLRAARVVRRDDGQWSLMQRPAHFDSIGDLARVDAIGRIMQLGLIGNQQRFILALQGNDTAPVYGAAVAAAEELMSRGNRSETISTLREAALFVKRMEPDSPVFNGLLRRWIKCAVMRNDARALEEILWALGSNNHEFRSVLEALRLAAVSPSQEAYDLLEACEDTGDQAVERCVRASMISCLARTGADLNPFLEEVRGWGRTVGDPEVESMCLMWEAKMKRMKEAYADAAKLAARAAQQRSHVNQRHNAYLVEAAAKFELLEYDEALQASEAVVAEGRRVGDPNSELYGALQVFMIHLRAGENPEPNMELVEVAKLIGYQSAETMARGQVAAAFERRGQIEEALEVLKPAALREKPVAGNSLGLMVAAQMAYLEGRRVPTAIIEASRETQHRKNLATVLCAAAIAEPNEVARQMLTEAFSLLSTGEQHAFLYFVSPAEVADRLGMNDLLSGRAKELVN